MNDDDDDDDADGENDNDRDGGDAEDDDDDGRAGDVAIRSGDVVGHGGGSDVDEDASLSALIDIKTSAVSHARDSAKVNRLNALSVCFSSSRCSSKRARHESLDRIGPYMSS